MLETDLLKIADLGDEREEENMKFREFIKRHCPLEEEEIDALVQEATREVAAQIDCDACRNCCTMMPTLEEGELEALADAKGMSLDEFRRSHVVRNEDKKLALKLPCPFLRHEERKSVCTAGDAAPRLCREYPYLMKPGIIWRMLGVVNEYARCPIVFNVYERLKTRLADEFKAAEPAIDEYWEWPDD